MEHLQEARGWVLKKYPRKMARRPENRRKRSTQRSELEQELTRQLWVKDLPPFLTEHRFCALHVGLGAGVKTRLQQAGLKDWRFDFAWPDLQLAVEVEGGGWNQGGHNRGEGFAKDLQKYHHAARLGWFLYRCDAALISSGLAVMFIESWIHQELARRQGFKDLLDSWWQRQKDQTDQADHLAEQDPASARMLDHGVTAISSCRAELKRLLKQQTEWG